MNRGQTGPTENEPVVVGKILTAHGVRGEVSVLPLSDFPERFEKGSSLWLNGEQVTVQSSRGQARNLLLKLSGVENREAARALSGAFLTVPEPAPLEEEDMYYQHDLIGLPVEDDQGELLGILAEIIETGASDVYVVRGERGELLLPALDEVVKQVDLAAGRLVVELLPGLDFRPQRPKRPAGGLKNPRRRG